ncbi:WD40 repeat domain-containing serine/threonine protein kinase [Actinomadura fulvescens]|uniref:WD40 repeat domain-containing serine/threonine protein kinase n=1 Tax=Actinomadura fulvescens TaxID=46160 RepID=UPI0031CF2FB2
MPLLPGDPVQLGPYWLAGRLGAGGQGVVYEGYDAQGARVAVKALHAEFVGDGHREMLRREVRALGQVASFCTAKVLGADLDGRVPYVVSEYVPGRDLAAAVAANGPCGPDGLLRLAIGMATALSAIHRAGVVHRDLKPANVLLGPDGPRVIDFGIARMEEMSRSVSGALKGTPRWMAPEVFGGRRAGPQVDIWAWGAVVLFAATGRPPFAGDSLPEVMHQVTHHEPDTGPLDEPLRSLVRAALAKDPGGRPSARDLLLGLIGGEDLGDGRRAAAEIEAEPAAEVSLAELAEDAYGRLPEAARPAVPGVMLRMVAPGQDADETLRRARVGELASDESGRQGGGENGGEPFDLILREFTAAGVLVRDGDELAIANAALLRAWPRLREWVQAERPGLSAQVALADAARFWDEHGRRRGDLLQGTALERARDWAAAGRRLLVLNPVERQFLQAASALVTRRARARALLSALLAVLLIVAIGAVVITLQQSRRLTEQRDAAVSARLATLVNDLRRADPRLARQLAIAAMRLGDPVEARSALLTVAHQWEDDLTPIPGFEKGAPETFAADRSVRLLAYAKKGEATVTVVDLDKRTVVSTYTAPAAVVSVAMSPDGSTVLARTANNSAHVLDSRTGTPRFAHQYCKCGEYWSLTERGDHIVIKDDGYLASKSVRVLDARTNRWIFRKEAVARFGFWLSPDLRWAALTDGGRDGRLTWTDLRTRKTVPGPTFGLTDRERLDNVVFSPDGRTIAAAVGRKAGGGELRTAKADFGSESSAYGELGEVDPSGFVHFSSDGSLVASRRNVWSVQSRRPVMEYSTSTADCEYGNFGFGPGDTSLRCLSRPGMVRSLDISAFTRASFNIDRAVGSALFTADGQTLAVTTGAGGASTRAVELWDVRRQARRSAGIEIPAHGRFNPGILALSNDARHLVTRGADGVLQLWDTGTGSKVMDQPGKTADLAAIAPDNRHLVFQVGEPSGARSIQHWRLRPLGLIKEIRLPKPSRLNTQELTGLFFHPNGRSVVSDHYGVIEWPSGRFLARRTTPGFSVVGVTGDGTQTIIDDGVDLGFWSLPSWRPAGRDLPTGDHVTQRPLVAVRGDLIATAVPNGGRYPRIRLWDLDRKHPLVPLPGHDGEILAMAFTPDGESLVSVDSRGKVLSHTVATRRVIAELCARSGQLSRRDWATHIPEAPHQNSC